MTATPDLVLMYNLICFNIVMVNKTKLMAPTYSYIAINFYRHYINVEEGG